MVQRSIDTELKHFEASKCGRAGPGEMGDRDNRGWVTRWQDLARQRPRTRLPNGRGNRPAAKTLVLSRWRIYFAASSAAETRRSGSQGRDASGWRGFDVNGDRPRCRWTCTRCSIWRLATGSDAFRSQGSAKVLARGSGQKLESSRCLFRSKLFCLLAPLPRQLMIRRKPKGLELAQHDRVVGRCEHKGRRCVLRLGRTP